MGLIDTIKGLFVKKDVYEQIKEFADEGNTGRLVKLANPGTPIDVRLAAIEALKEILHVEEEA